MTGRPLRCSAVVTVALGFWSAQPAGQPSAQAVDAIIDRATAYVGEFVAGFSRLVAQEDYRQEFLRSGIQGSKGSFAGAPQVVERRHLRSDLLLVSLPESQGWQVFRDVFEQDGRAVRDRQERLSRLFVDGRSTTTALDQATQIAAASAQFNIRPMGTVDNPLMALGFLQEPVRARFRFTDRGFDASVGANARVVEFRETARPTINRRAGDKDIFARGRFWIVPDTGEIVRSEVGFSALGSETSVATDFAYDDRLGTRVPAEMRFKWATSNTEIRCTATYGDFRRFEVHTEEAIQK